MTAVPPSPQSKSPSPDLPPQVARDPKRLIIIVVTPGEDVEVDFDGSFAWWELEAALQRALDQVQDTRAEDELEEDG